MAALPRPDRGAARLVLSAVLAAALALVYVFDLTDYLSFQALAENEAALKALVARMPIIAAALYMAVYVLAVALSIPGAIWLSLAGGLLFGTLQGGLLIVVSASCGAALLFLVARYLAGDALRARAGPGLKNFEAAFNRDAASYLLVLRLLPIFPFFIVNLGAALVGARFSTFVVTTFFGIMPATFVFASIGNGISVLLQAGEAPNLSIVTRPDIMLPLTGLALLSLMPVVWRRFFGAPVILPAASDEASAAATGDNIGDNSGDNNMSETVKTDICVIGGGSGGLSVAAGAAQMGADVVLVEGGKMGGDCLNYGCVPSKALLAAAAHAHHGDVASFGLTGGRKRVSFSKVMAHVRDVIDGIAPMDSVERFSKLGVRVIEAYGHFYRPAHTGRR